MKLNYQLMTWGLAFLAVVAAVILWVAARWLDAASIGAIALAVFPIVAILLIRISQEAKKEKRDAETPPSDGP